MSRAYRLNIADLLDRVPRRYRPLPGLAGAAAIAAYELHMHIGLHLMTPALIALPALAGATVLLRIRKPAPQSQMRVRALEIEISGPQEERSQAVLSIAQTLKERARAGRVRYLAMTALQGGLIRNIVVVSGPDQRSVDVEYEVLKTLLAVTYKGIRIKEVSEELGGALANMVGLINPDSRSEPLYVPAFDEPSLPATGEGGIYLGRGFDGAFEKDVYIRLSDLAGHVGIFGSTGTGKTTTLAALAHEASKEGLGVVVLDWAGEVSRALRKHGIVNFKELNPLEDASINPFQIEELYNKVDLLVDVFSKALTLSPPQTYLLMKVIEEKRPSSMAELSRYVDEYPEEARWDRDVKRGLLRKIDLVAHRPLSMAFQGRLSVAQLEEGFNVIRMDLIESTIARRVYGMLLLASMFVRRGRQRPVLLAIDEAHNLTDDEDLLGQIMAESRKYGLYIAVATQSPAAVPNGVLLNANTKIVHALRSLRDKEVIEQSMNLRPGLSERLDKLEPGEAIVQAPSLTSPILVKVKFMAPRDKPLNDALIREPVYVNSNVPHV